MNRSSGAGELTRARRRPPHRPRRPPMAGALVVAAVAALGLAGCASSGSAGGGSGTNTTAPSTVAPTTTTAGPPAPVAKLYTNALASVSRASSVHFVATSDGTSSSGTTRVSYVGDVGISDGMLVATWSGADEKGRFTVIVIGAATYLQADAPTLATFFGVMPATDAATYAGKWISFATTDKLYASLRDETTLAQVSTSLKFRPSRQLATSGARIVISGLPLSSAAVPKGEKASTTLTISSTTDLPEMQAFSASDNGATDTSSISFSDWNSARLTAAPAGSITWDSIAVAITPTTTAAG